MKDMLFPQTNFFLDMTNLSISRTHISRKFSRSHSEGLIFPTDNLNNKYSLSVSLKKVLQPLVYYSGLQFCKLHFHNIAQGRSHREGGGRGLYPPYFNLQTKRGPKVLVLIIRDIAFYGCSEIIRTRNATIFNMYATIFGLFLVWKYVKKINSC